MRFMVAGGIATLAYSGLTIGLVETGALRNPLMASAVASLITIPMSFFAHKFITFSDVSYSPRQWPRYGFVALTNLVVNVGLIRLGLSTAIPYPVMIAVGWVVVPAVNYLVNALWVFRTRSLLTISRRNQT